MDEETNPYERSGRLRLRELIKTHKLKHRTLGDDIYQFNDDFIATNVQESLAFAEGYDRAMATRTSSRLAHYAADLKFRIDRWIFRHNPTAQRRIRKMFEVAPGEINPDCSELKDNDWFKRPRSSD